MRLLALAATGLVGACAQNPEPRRAIAGAEPKRGLAVIERVGCGACHDIPGVSWPKGATGGPLAAFGDRPFIAGRLPNQPQVLTAWVRDAPALAPTTAMPAMPINEAEARDVAAYLYTLHGR
ncbi:MAG: cytochrome C [Caulobacterales bacterium 32-69-10]|nr:MAG: cytochrome C [Caulobacterales bacterium 32-69-10]